MRKIVILLFLGFIFQNSFAQKELNHQNELGFNLGGLMYIGDLNPTPSVSSLNLGGQLFFRKNFTNNVSVLRANILFGTISADETQSDNALPKSRGLSFSSQIVEISGIYEYNFLDFRNMTRNERFSPFVFIGLGATIVVGEQDRVFATMPFGMGVKYAIAKQLNFNVELGFRKVFSDNLDGYDDDVALNSSIPNDWYHFLGLGLTYTFYKQQCPRTSPNF